MQETWVQSLGWEDPLEKETATYSSILAWRIPWTIQTMGMDLGQVSICILVLSLICYIIISEPRFLFLQNNNNPCS